MMNKLTERAFYKCKHNQIKSEWTLKLEYTRQPAASLYIMYYHLNLMFQLCFHFQGEYGGGNQRKTSGTLHLLNVTVEDDGVYTCVTHNSLLNISKRSKPARLTVQGEFILKFYTIPYHTFSCSGHSYPNPNPATLQGSRKDSRSHRALTTSLLP